jgi:hypothetical protein
MAIDVYVKKARNQKWTQTRTQSVDERSFLLGRSAEI